MLNAYTMSRISARMREVYQTPEDRAVFSARPPKEKVEALLLACAPLNLGPLADKLLAAYVVCFALKCGTVKANSPEHYALTEELGVHVASCWMKSLPPQSYPDFYIPMRDPSWTEEISAMSEVAEEIDFASATNYNAVAAAVLCHFNLGGMETLDDARGIPLSDPTLKILVETAQANLRYKRPDWYVDGGLMGVLPPGVDGSSLTHRKQVAEEEAAARKEAAAKAATAARREQARKDLIARRTAAFALIDAWTGEVRPVLEKLCATAVTFDQWKDALTAAGDGRWLPEALDPVVLAVRATLGEVPAPDFTKLTPEAAAAKTEKWEQETAKKDLEAVNHVQQYVLRAHAARNTTWFAELVDGSLQIRPQPLTSRPPTRTRAARACESVVSRLWTKYGILELLKALNAVVGPDTVVIKPAGEYPPPPTVVITDEEKEEEAAETPPPPPTEG